MSEKDCGSHGKKRRLIYKRICAGILIFIFLVLLTILIVWAVLQPKKPRFIIQDATVYAFNVSTPNFITSNIQITISSRNPNDEIGIYYDWMDIYASYRNQQISLRTAIPPTYEGHKETNVWSPFVYGTAVPVAPYNFVALNQDESTGSVTLVIKIDGRIRFKVGSFTTGKYRLHVKCPAFIPLGSRSSGVVVSENAVKYQLVTSCRVSV
ncbi:protein YLS9-like [Tripterygium wilfordii]|uniref:Protein YLS9-like n=1 Tax=Tripterygium wilfordii TaxID=458696 RepID=A0A7J7DN99_TRIWF|nr:NDR1/HIN1-like protein 1 [Tripterygium wilfordii]KAF5747763.1 protein YLS9-like [Tripterygium wilfordii]